MVLVVSSSLSSIQMRYECGDSFGRLYKNSFYSAQKKLHLSGQSKHARGKCVPDYRQGTADATAHKSEVDLRIII
jgi:hypothetical protein